MDLPFWGSRPYIGFIGSWAVPYGMNIFEMSRSEASQLVMYGLFGALIGGPLIGWITSRLGSLKKSTHLCISLCCFVGLGFF